VVPPLRSAAGRVGFVIVTAPSADELDRRTADALAAIDLAVAADAAA
jgi:hypothetical protein